LIKIQDITLGQFAPRESIIHRLDPRTKILGSFFLMIMILFTNRWEVILLYFVVVSLFYILSKLNLTLGLKNLKPFIWLFLITILLHTLFSDGKVLFSVPLLSINATREGLVKGIFYTLRIIVIMLTATLLTLTTSPMSITDAIEKFLRPFRKLAIPSHEIAMMVSLSLRFIPILIDEADRIRKAQESRGARFGGNIVQRIRSIIPVLVPLFISTFRRANDLALAMDSRCYRGSENRTNYFLLRFGINDYIAVVILIITCIPIFIFR